MVNNLIGSLSKFTDAKILVIGDFLLDTYTIGKATRISPEAPVAIIKVEKEDSLPGGAGNVVLNLHSLGATVIPIGRIGRDLGGEKLLQLLAKEGIATDYLFYQNAYPTPVKNRVIADNQQIVRIDHEQVVGLPELLEQEIVAKLPEILHEVKIIAVSDYGKGFLSPILLSEILTLAKEKAIPVITDPKGSDFQKYVCTTILKPNLKEAYAAAELPLEAPIEEVAKKILAQTQAEVLMITRAEKGISLFYQSGQRGDFPVEQREVRDVTGAGDTVLAVLASGLASGISLEEAVKLSNVAAGIAIEKVGCARVSLSDLADRLLEKDVQNKVFDENHRFALAKSLQNKDFALVGLSEKDGLTKQLFHQLLELSHRKKLCVLLYIFDPSPSRDFIEMLASLQVVHFILLEQEGIEKLCEDVSPKEIYLSHLGQFTQLDSLDVFKTTALETSGL